MKIKLYTEEYGEKEWKLKIISLNQKSILLKKYKENKERLGYPKQMACSFLTYTYQGRILFRIPFLINTALAGEFSEYRKITSNEIKCEWEDLCYWPKSNKKEKPRDLVRLYLLHYLGYSPTMVFLDVTPRNISEETPGNFKGKLDSEGLISKDYSYLVKNAKKVRLPSELSSTNLNSLWRGITRPVHDIESRSEPTSLECFFAQISIDSKYLIDNLASQLGELLAYGGENKRGASPVAFFNEEYFISLDSYINQVDKTELYNTLGEIIEDLRDSLYNNKKLVSRLSPISSISKDYIIKLLEDKVYLDKIHNLSEVYLSKLRTRRDLIFFVSCLIGSQYDYLDQKFSLNFSSPEGKWFNEYRSLDKCFDYTFLQGYLGDYNIDLYKYRMLELFRKLRVILKKEIENK